MLLRRVAFENIVITGSDNGLSPVRCIGWNKAEIAVRFEYNYKIIHSCKCIWKCRLEKSATLVKQQCGHHAQRNSSFIIRPLCERILPLAVDYMIIKREKVFKLVIVLCIGNASKMCIYFALDNKCVNPSTELRMKTIMANLCLVYVHATCEVVWHTREQQT